MIGGISSSFGMMGGMRSGGMQPDPQKMLNRIDENGDGGISEDEMQSMSEILSEKTGQSFDMDELFSEFDADENGVLNSDEIKSAMDSIREEMERQMQWAMMGGMEPDFRQVFERLDEDEDGGIGKDEMQALVDKLSEKTGQSFDMDELFSEFDTDEDGVLDSDEAKSAMDSIKEEMKNQLQTNMGTNDFRMTAMEKIASYQSNATGFEGSTLQHLLSGLSNEDEQDNTSLQDMPASSLGENRFGNVFPISLFA